MMQRGLLLLLLFLTNMLSVSADAPAMISTNLKATVEERVTDLLGRMTQPEKLSLLALHNGGDDTLNLLPIDRLGIGSLHTADGPNAVRYGQSQATVFPMGVTMASTWNPALVEQVGAALGQEAVAKNKQVNGSQRGSPKKATVPNLG